MIRSRVGGIFVDSNECILVSTLGSYVRYVWFSVQQCFLIIASCGGQINEYSSAKTLRYLYLYKTQLLYMYLPS